MDGQFEILDDDPDWVRLEKLAARVQSKLAPRAVVKHNDHIIGRNSKKSRQIDVSIKERIGQFELLMVLSCKNYKRKIDVTDAEEFAALIDDVGANKGAMICNAGYTDGAKNTASAKGIDLLLLLDAERMDWQRYITIPVVCEFRKPLVSFGIEETSTEPFSIQSDPHKWIIYNEANERLGSIVEVFKKLWNEQKVPHEPGNHIVSYENLKIHNLSTNRPHPIKITMRVRVTRNLFFGGVGLKSAEGFANVNTGEMTIRNFETLDIDVVEVERSWKKINSVDELAVKPVFQLVASDYFSEPDFK